MKLSELSDSSDIEDMRDLRHMIGTAPTLVAPNTSCTMWTPDWLDYPHIIAHRADFSPGLNQCVRNESKVVRSTATVATYKLPWSSGLNNFVWNILQPSAVSYERCERCVRYRLYRTVIIIIFYCPRTQCNTNIDTNASPVAIGQRCFVSSNLNEQIQNKRRQTRNQSILHFQIDFDSLRWNRRLLITTNSTVLQSKWECDSIFDRCSMVRHHASFGPPSKVERTHFLRILSWTPAVKRTNYLLTFSPTPICNHGQVFSVHLRSLNPKQQKTDFFIMVSNKIFVFRGRKLVQIFVTQVTDFRLIQEHVIEERIPEVHTIKTANGLCVSGVSPALLRPLISVSLIRCHCFCRCHWGPILSVICPSGLQNRSRSQSSNKKCLFHSNHTTKQIITEILYRISGHLF